MKENRVGQPSTIGEIIIIPLEEVYLYCDKREDGFRHSLNLLLTYRGRNWI